MDPAPDHRFESQPPEPGEAEIEAAAAFLEARAWEAAIGAVMPLLRADPADPEANLLKGLAEAGLGRLDEAESSLRCSLAGDSGHSIAWTSLATVLERRGAFDEAADARLDAWRCDPEEGSLAAAAAGALFNAGRLEEAVEPARAAASLGNAAPTHAVRLAGLLALLDRREEAIEVFDRVLAGHPTLTAVRVARGVAALPSVPRDLAEVGHATATFRRMIEANTTSLDDDAASAGFSPGLDAPSAASTAASLEGLAFFGDAGLPWPFLRAAWCEPDPAAARAFAAIFAASAGLAKSATSAAPVNSVASTPRVASSLARLSGSPRRRVGVLSGLWCDHVVAHLFLEGWVRHLDRSRFEVVAIDVGRRRDAFGDSLLARADRVERGMRPFAAWASTIESLACDAILWPEIGIEPVATRLAALRFAPVQAVAWGHPETTGLASIDAFLSSEAMEPQSAASHYVETLVRLPRLGAWIARPDVPSPAPRASLGWAESATVFWCAQTPHKHHPRFDALYASIAAALPDSRFVFSLPQGRASAASRFRARLEAAFAAAGADPARHLEFLPRLETRGFRTRLGAADVFLDPPGWSGGHTTLEAIAAGVPVLTMPGSFMRRRHAGGILATIDPERTLWGDLVAGNEADFVSRAIDLARDAERRRSLSAAIKSASPRAFEDLEPIRALEEWLDRAVGGASRAG